MSMLYTHLQLHTNVLQTNGYLELEVFSSTLSVQTSNDEKIGSVFFTTCISVTAIDVLLKTKQKSGEQTAGPKQSCVSWRGANWQLILLQLSACVHIHHTSAYLPRNIFFFTPDTWHICVCVLFFPSNFGNGDLVWKKDRRDRTRTDGAFFKHLSFIAPHSWVSPLLSGDCQDLSVALKGLSKVNFTSMPIKWIFSSSFFLCTVELHTHTKKNVMTKNWFWVAKLSPVAVEKFNCLLVHVRYQTS